MTHAQGPWKIHPDGSDLMIVASGHHVATVPIGGSIDEPEDRANARLIAAAPELYAALKIALDAGNIEYEGKDWRKMARAAIAKVEAVAVNYAEWAKQYAQTLSLWGRQPTYMRGWVQDLVDANPDADPNAAWAELYKLPHKQRSHA